jgi:hypothetical protein
MIFKRPDVCKQTRWSLLATCGLRLHLCHSLLARNRLASCHWLSYLPTCRPPPSFEKRHEQTMPQRGVIQKIDKKSDIQKRFTLLSSCKKGLWCLGIFTDIMNPAKISRSGLLILRLLYPLEDRDLSTIIIQSHNYRPADIAIYPAEFWVNH